MLPAPCYRFPAGSHPDRAPRSLRAGADSAAFDGRRRSEPDQHLELYALLLPQSGAVAWLPRRRPATAARKAARASPALERAAPVALRPPRRLSIFRVLPATPLPPDRGALGRAGDHQPFPTAAAAPLASR